MCLRVVMAPVDWQGLAVYTAAFFGLLLYLWDGWGWVLSSRTWQVSSIHPKKSHTHPYQALCHCTCCWISKALSGFCSVWKQGRECPDTKVLAATRRPCRICFTMSSCERAPVGAPTPPPPLQLLSSFTHPQWALGISHHDLVSPITKNPVASFESTLPYTYAQASKRLQQHSSEWCMKEKLEMTSCLKWTDSE